MNNPSRRQLLRGASLLGLAAFSRPLLAAPDWITGKARFIDHPFKLGIASGDATPSGFVIWTRLCIDPLDASATGPDPIPVGYEIAEDAAFKKPVQRGHVVAHPENAHAVHVDVQGLKAGRPYWYRFMAGDETSPTGRAVTTPGIMAPLDRLKVAVASCQNFEQGYFTAYRDMIQQDVDLIVHLGDYIYEYASSYDIVRRSPMQLARSLDEYRAFHATYKLDADLQAAHAHTSWLNTWDDHEVANDYAGDQDQDYEDPKSFLIRRAAAYKAYYEHLPLRRAAQPEGPDAGLYQRVAYGNLMEINMLDTRQYRDDQPCQTPDDGGWRLIEGTCAERFDEKRSILGAEQERWLLGRFRYSRAKWNVIAQGMLFSKFDHKVGDGELYGSEYWDGYLGSRNRVLAAMEQSKLSNPVIIGGDVHATYVCDVKKDFDDPASETLASEFVCTSITSGNNYHDRNAAALPDNPHVKMYEGRYRGYTLMDFGQGQMKADMRVMDTVATPDGKAKTLRRFVVEDGKAGPEDA